MSSAAQAATIISFMLIFNTLVGYYAISNPQEMGIDELPDIDPDPGVFDYILIFFQYIAIFFKLVFFGITGVPAIFSVFIIAMNAVFALILIRAITGGS